MIVGTPKNTFKLRNKYSLQLTACTSNLGLYTS